MADPVQLALIFAKTLAPDKVWPGSRLLTENMHIVHERAITTVASRRHCCSALHTPTHTGDHPAGRAGAQAPDSPGRLQHHRTAGVCGGPMCASGWLVVARSGICAACLLALFGPVNSPSSQGNSQCTSLSCTLRTIPAPSSPLQLVATNSVDAAVRLAAAVSFKNLIKYRWVRVCVHAAASQLCEQNVCPTSMQAQRGEEVHRSVQCVNVQNWGHTCSLSAGLGMRAAVSMLCLCMMCAQRLQSTRLMLANRCRHALVDA